MLLGCRLVIIDPQGNIDLSFLGKDCHLAHLGTKEASINILDITRDELSDQVASVKNTLKMLGVCTVTLLSEVASRALIIFIDKFINQNPIPLNQGRAHRACGNFKRLHHKSSDNHGQNKGNQQRFRVFANYCFNFIIHLIFLFNHSCKGTLGLEVSAFEDLYDGPIFQGRATGSDDCPGYCPHEDSLDPCLVKCECAFVREIIQILKK